MCGWARGFAVDFHMAERWDSDQAWEECAEDGEFGERGDPGE